MRTGVPKLKDDSRVHKERLELGDADPSQMVFCFVATCMTIPYGRFESCFYLLPSAGAVSPKQNGGAAHGPPRSPFAA